ncbi:MAG: hypothetical protein HUU25_11120 [Candidatus Sumerlaeia bacterium]|nr:hypothetical protein [Candidatus Sumerlaeia bacterium]
MKTRTKSPCRRPSPELRSVPGLRLAEPEELDTTPPPDKDEGTGQLEMF